MKEPEEAEAVAVWLDGLKEVAQDAGEGDNSTHCGVPLLNDANAKTNPVSLMLRASMTFQPAGSRLFKSTAPWLGSQIQPVCAKVGDGPVSCPTTIPKLFNAPHETVAVVPAATPPGKGISVTPETVPI